MTCDKRCEQRADMYRFTDCYLCPEGKKIALSKLFQRIILSLVAISCLILAGKQMYSSGRQAGRLETERAISEAVTCNKPFKMSSGRVVFLSKTSKVFRRAHPGKVRNRAKKYEETHKNYLDN